MRAANRDAFVGKPSYAVRADQTGVEPVATRQRADSARSLCAGHRLSEAAPAAVRTLPVGRDSVAGPG